METRRTGTGASKRIALAHEVSARGEFKWWMLLLAGAAFAFAGYTLDPRQNCNDGGECAPWLVPLALLLGIGAVLTALPQLMVNPRRGSFVDMGSGELIWWLGRVRSGQTQDHGRLPLDRIARVRIISGDDSADDVFLYDHDGQLLPFAGSDVIRWPYVRWAQDLRAFCPGLQIDED